MTGRLRLDELLADRDQLMAEAVEYHRAGVTPTRIGNLRRNTSNRSKRRDKR